MESIHLPFPTGDCSLAKVCKFLALILVRHEFDRSYCISRVISSPEAFSFGSSCLKMGLSLSLLLSPPQTSCFSSYSFSWEKCIRQTVWKGIKYFWNSMFGEGNSTLPHRTCLGYLELPEISPYLLASAQTIKGGLWTYMHLASSSPLPKVQ